jgi:conserved repeat domain
MPKFFKCILKYVGAFFIALFCFLIFNNTSIAVKAVDTATVEQNISKIDDGYTNWQESRSYDLSTTRGSIPISTGVSLDYTFGSARTSTGAVSTSPDPTVTAASSTVTGAVYNSKINVFINKNNKYYSILHQGPKSYIGGTDASPQKASDSSFDFALLYATSTDVYGYGSVLAKMTPKVLMYTKDINGRTVLKVGGYLPNGYAANTYAEIVLRPSITGAPIVQRELYVYNPSDGTRVPQFQTYFGEDTALNSDSTTFDSSTSTDPATNGDDVQLYAIGGGQGLYIDSGKSTGVSESKLFVTNNVEDGFKNYMGIVYSNPYNWTIKGKANGNGSDIITPNLGVGKTDPGDTDKPAGTPLLYGTTNSGSLFPVVDRNNRQNSAYTLRWDSTTLAKGATAHFASTIGATISPYAVPIVTKTYTNKSRTTGQNQIGDVLHFTLKVDNQGLNSNWSFNKLVDNLPKGLQLDKSSVKYTSTYFYGTTGSGQNIQDVMKPGPSGTFTPTSTSQLNVTPEAILKDKGTYTVSFDATITLDAAANLTNGALTNKATFTGNNKNANGTNLDPEQDYTASVKIPITPSNYKPSFTKKLRNSSTDPNGAFSSTATGKKGDTIDYQIQLTNSGTDSLKSADFSDELPAGLELKTDSVKLNGNSQVDGVTQSGMSFSLGSQSNTTTITFQATVTSATAMTADNIAVLKNIKTSAGYSYNNFQTDPATLNITETAPTTSLDEVPSMIDFGSINSDGSQRMLNNIRTNGRLRVTHASDTPFQITVSYDNDGNTPISTKDASGNVANKLVQNNDDALYYNQNNNVGKDNWQPILAGGLPINSAGFSGTYNDKDLTIYVGLDKWRLLIPANTKAGQYGGTITWSIYDTPQS